MSLNVFAFFKLFVAVIMCVGGAILSICYYCYLQDQDDIQASPKFRKKTSEQTDFDYEEDLSKEIVINIGEEPLAEKRPFENGGYTVDDKPTDGEGQ